MEIISKHQKSTSLSKCIILAVVILVIYSCEDYNRSVSKEFELAENAYLSNKTDSAFLLYHMVADISTDSGQMAHCYYQIGNIYKNDTNYRLAFEYYSRALSFVNEKKKTIIILSELGFVGILDTLYSGTSKRYLDSAFSIAKKMHDSLKILPSLYLGIYYNSIETDDYLSEYYFRKADSLVCIYPDSFMVYLFCTYYSDYWQSIDQDKADSLNSISLNISNQTDNLQLKAKAYYKTSYSYYLRNEFKEALTYFVKYDSIKKLILVNSSRFRDIIIEDISKKKKQVEKDNVILIVLIIMIFGTLILLLKKHFQVVKLKRINETMSRMQINEEIKKNKDLQEKSYDIENQKNQLEKQIKEKRGSIQYAKRIQRAILPDYHDMFRAIKSFNDYFIIYQPCDIVSGDFYYIFKKGNTVYVSVADCTGHGVPGAFMSMIGISVLKEIIELQNEEIPDIILCKLRERIVELLTQRGHNSTKDGMDMAMCVFDVESKLLKFSGANQSIYILRKKDKKNQLVEKEPDFTLIELKGDPQPVGIYNEMRNFNSQEYQLVNNDVIYLFSDGFVDQFGGEGGKKYMSKRFKEKLKAICSKDMKTQKRELRKEFIKWKGTSFQVDDVTVIGIRI